MLNVSGATSSGLFYIVTFYYLAFDALFAVGSAVLVPNCAKADSLARTLKPEPRFGEV